MIDPFTSEYRPGSKIVYNVLHQCNWCNSAYYENGLTISGDTSRIVKQKKQIAGANGKYSSVKHKGRTQRRET
jgi:hypothetical protein